MQVPCQTQACLWRGLAEGEGLGGVVETGTLRRMELEAMAIRREQHAVPRERLGFGGSWSNRLQRGSLRRQLARGMRRATRDSQWRQTAGRRRCADPAILPNWSSLLGQCEMGGRLAGWPAGAVEHAEEVELSRQQPRCLHTHSTPLIPFRRSAIPRRAAPPPARFRFRVSDPQLPAHAS